MALLLALTAALLLFRVGRVPLIGPDEPRYARVAVEMYRSGDFVTPTLQGQPWLEKPPLYYWLAAAAFAVLGETETAARLPSVVAALLLVAATVFVGARLYGPEAGLHAGFVAALAPLTFVYGRAAAMDMLLAATVTGAVGLFSLRLLGVTGRLAVPAAWGLMALATLAKGPLGFLLPGLIMAGYVVAKRQWGLLREVLSPAGIALFLLVAGPWYVLVGLDQGRTFVDVFLLNHNLQRFTSTIHRHPGPLFYYVPVLLLGVFPWTGLTLAGIGLQLRAAREAGFISPGAAQRTRWISGGEFTSTPRKTRAGVQGAATQHPLAQHDLFVLLWLALPLLFFSAAGSKLPGYILPCLPPLALITGRAARAMANGELRGPLGTGPRAAAMVTLLLACVVAATPLLLRRLSEPDWRLAVPFSAWCLVVGLGLRLRAQRDPPGALGLLRVGAAGMLVLLALAAPPILARRESGKAFFTRTAGHEVLAWGAWRTAWMAGYFYNDGKVREVQGEDQIAAATAAGPALVLAGPGERRRLEAAPGLTVTVLAEGPRRTSMLWVRRR
jgi:4-amino-4-deoxy-L-arabinose transferase-like glycosyltransferase